MLGIKNPFLPFILQKFLRQALFSCFICLTLAFCAFAQGNSSADHSQPPVQEDQPRRDYEMGTTQGNIFIGRDSQDNEVVEVKPIRKNQDKQQQPNIGPIIVVPKVSNK